MTKTERDFYRHDVAQRRKFGIYPHQTPVHHGQLLALLDDSERAETLESERDALAASHRAMDEALTKIDAIRNSIIGLQTINWSEHIYPLVAALDAAGYEGAGYDVSRENVGTLLERATNAESQLRAMTERAEIMRRALKDVAESILVNERVPTAADVARAALTAATEESTNV